MDDYGTVAKCPECDGEYLHQSGVEAFFRDSECAMTGAHVTASTDDDRPPSMSADRSMAGNPSPRRDGMMIRFWCECCGAVVGMYVMQHKGQTFIRWG